MTTNCNPCKSHNLYCLSLTFVVALQIIISGSYHSCEALSIPTSPTAQRQGQQQQGWQFNAAPNQPRLASAVSAMLHVATRTSLLVFPSFSLFHKGSGDDNVDDDVRAGSVKDLTVRVCANSNRDVLRGNFKEISIHAQQSKSSFLNWLQISNLDIYGSNLQFGYTPFLLCGVMPILLAIIRPSIRFGLSMYLYYYIFNKLYLANKQQQQQQQSLQSSTSSLSCVVGTWIQKHLGGAPSVLDYKITISNQDIAKSKLLTRALNFVLQSLMQNSVLKTAAVAGDTMTMLQEQQQEQYNNNNNNNADGRRTTRPLPTDRRIGGGDGGGGDASSTFNPSTTPTNDEDDNNMSLFPSSSSSSSSSSSPTTTSLSFKLTKLLSATSFQLKDAKFVDKRLQMSCQAVLPFDDGNTINKETSENSNVKLNNDNIQTKLDFILRTNLESTKVIPPTTRAQQEQQSQSNVPALAFTSPECRFDMDATPMRNNPIGKLFLPPVVWIPVGTGIAIPFTGLLGGTKQRHSLRRIEIFNSNSNNSSNNSNNNNNNNKRQHGEGEEAKCEISGRISIHSKEKEKKNIQQNIQQFVDSQFLLGSGDISSSRLAKNQGKRNKWLPSLGSSNGDDD